MKNWIETTLKDFVDVESGFAFKSNIFVENGIPVVKIGNISEYTTVTTNADDFIDEKDVEQYKDYLLQEGDILIAMSGNTTCKMGRVSKRFSPSLVNQRVGWITPKSEEIDISFVYYLLTNETFQNRLWNFATATGQPNLSPRDIKKISFPKPPKPEQTAIATILFKVDEAIEATRQSIKAAEKLKKALMQNLLTGKLKPDGTWRNDDEFYEDEKFGKVPIGWEVEKFKKSVLVQYGKSQKEIVSENGKIPIYGTGGIIEYGTKSLCDTESILIGRKGTIDKPFFINVPFWAVDTTYYVESFKNGNMKYFFYLLQRKNLKTLNEATGVPSLTRRTLNNQLFVFPPLIEQNAIVSKINSIDIKIQSKQTKIRTLQRLKKSLMQNLLTGKIRLNVEQINKTISKQTNG